ncbi:hypothetical protein M2157_008935 [Streptomyces sp. SAI-127]|nr:hypothetical protein [Streptomyces sp. SAI-127]
MAPQAFAHTAPAGTTERKAAVRRSHAPGCHCPGSAAATSSAGRCSGPSSPSWLIHNSTPSGPRGGGLSGKEAAARWHRRAVTRLSGRGPVQHLLGQIHADHLREQAAPDAGSRTVRRQNGRCRRPGSGGPPPDRGRGRGRPRPSIRRSHGRHGGCFSRPAAQGGSTSGGPETDRHSHLCLPSSSSRRAATARTGRPLSRAGRSGRQPPWRSCHRPHPPHPSPARPPPPVAGCPTDRPRTPR